MNLDDVTAVRHTLHALQLLCWTNTRHKKWLPTLHKLESLHGLAIAALACYLTISHHTQWNPLSRHHSYVKYVALNQSKHSRQAHWLRVTFGLLFPEPQRSRMTCWHSELPPSQSGAVFHRVEVQPIIAILTRSASHLCNQPISSTFQYHGSNPRISLTTCMSQGGTLSCSLSVPHESVKIRAHRCHSSKHIENTASQEQAIEPHQPLRYGVYAGTDLLTRLASPSQQMASSIA